MGNVADMVAGFGTGRDACIKILPEIQAGCGYLPYEECQFVLTKLRMACWRKEGDDVFLTLKASQPFQKIDSW